MDFLLSCNEFVIVVSAATWYFSNKQVHDDDGIAGEAQVWKGFVWIPLYHFGSLALGSLLISVIWVIRGAFEYVARNTQDAVAENVLTGCLLSSIRCCLDCFDRFMRYLTKNAYIYLAITSEGFCSSALNSFLLLLKNSVKFAFVEGFSEFLMLIAKLSISMASTAVSLLILRWSVTDQPQSPIYPGIVMLLVALIISKIFVQIFETSANTLLQCYLIDADVARQKRLEPTHVPKTLAKFLRDNLEDDGLDGIEIAEQKRNLIN